MTTAAVVLAAGASRRLGRSKQLEPWGESNLLSNVVARTRSFPVDEVWVVLGHDYERILEETEFGDAGVIENPEWAEGIASSIRVALDAL
ncbi:MAG TPA: NTP transferase domain-containing protein, partial [Acidimicrobiia bacterium]|nr:NTP transferase domain-containing protein [Acidimicrobiia bacterium]